MTDIPDTQAPLTQDDARSSLKQAEEIIRENIAEAVLLMREEGSPSPVAASAEILGWVMTELSQGLPIDGVRQAALIAFESAHLKPMSFIDINSTRAALVAIAGIRRKRLGMPSLIIPGDLQP